MTRLIRCLFFAALAFAVVMAVLPKPPSLPLDQLGDKFEHMLAFATLALLARLAWPKAHDLRILERLAFVGALIEVFQAWPPLHRDCDPKDWIADVLAIAVILLLCRIGRKIWG